MNQKYMCRYIVTLIIKCIHQTVRFGLKFEFVFPKLRPTHKSITSNIAVGALSTPVQILHRCESAQADASSILYNASSLIL